MKTVIIIIIVQPENCTEKRRIQTDTVSRENIVYVYLKADSTTSESLQRDRNTRKPQKSKLRSDQRGLAALKPPKLLTEWNVIDGSESI